ncbi:MAG TPA: hypothetical protein VGS41_14940 [Chthonomonadales bacterium]|nr:hypothetical protein [Chthonomonadales bacterium]
MVTNLAATWLAHAPRVRLQVAASTLMALPFLFWLPGTLQSRRRLGGADLLQSSARMATLDQAIGDYDWLSSHSVLVWTASPRVHVGILDLNSGKQRELTSIEDAIRRSEMSATGFAVSPDRRWLYWREIHIGLPRLMWHAARIDGTDVIHGTLDDSYYGDVVWNPDSKGWSYFV